MKHKSIASSTMFVVLLSLASCSGWTECDATGIYDATTVTVSAEATGKIMWLDISEGDSVVCGKDLGVIDAILLVLKCKQLESHVSSGCRCCMYCSRWVWACVYLH